MRLIIVPISLHSFFILIKITKFVSRFILFVLQYDNMIAKFCLYTKQKLSSSLKILIPFKVTATTTKIFSIIFSQTQVMVSIKKYFQLKSLVLESLFSIGMGTIVLFVQCKIINVHRVNCKSFFSNGVNGILTLKAFII